MTTPTPPGLDGNPSYSTDDPGRAATAATNRKGHAIMTPHTTPEYLDGERYADTAHLSADELAQVIASELADTANPYGLPEHVTYEASADTRGPLPQLLIRVIGITPADGDMATESAVLTVYGAVAEYGRLRFDGMLPRPVRFEHTVVAKAPDGRLLSSDG